MCVIQISQQRGTELYHKCYLLTVRTTQACSTATPGDKTLVKCIFFLKITLDHSLMINYDNKTNKCLFSYALDFIILINHQWMVKSYFFNTFNQCFVTWNRNTTSLSGSNGKQVTFVVKFSPSLLRYLNNAYYWTTATTTIYLSCGSVNISLI